MIWILKPRGGTQKKVTWRRRQEAGVMQLQAKAPQGWPGVPKSWEEARKDSSLKTWEQGSPTSRIWCLSWSWCNNNRNKVHIHVMRLNHPETTGFPGGPDGKDPTCQCRRHERQIRSLDQEEPLEKGMAAHSTILAWRIPRTEEPGGLQSRGSQKS